ncbi:hypothetical protein [uncultured Ilyobacter sp.]|uniref:hypothetical protein n=1 Tax=uncultured Ilyobacter sp. TaxID=544433 RepID=UPI0029C7C61A|nr:hypothetical protein [uncultured Ilyobacter sp.]
MKNLNILDNEALYKYEELIMDTNHYVYDGGEMSNSCEAVEEIYTFEEKLDEFEVMKELIEDTNYHVYDGHVDTVMTRSTDEEIYIFPKSEVFQEIKELIEDTNHFVYDGVAV